MNRYIALLKALKINIISLIKEFTEGLFERIIIIPPFISFTYLVANRGSFG